MVQEEMQADLPVKVFKSDNGKFVIRCKGLSLEKFEDKISKDKYVESPGLRDALIDRWLFFRTKPADKFVPYTRAELLAAIDEFKEYVFRGYN